MIRFVFRFVGLVSLALGFLVLVHDGTKSIADQKVYISSVESTWDNIHQSSLAALEPAVEKLAGAWVWTGVIQPYFLKQPVSLVLVIVGAILILLGRKKKPLIGSAREWTRGTAAQNPRSAVTSSAASYLTVSAPALHATASWSPVAPLQPIAPMILPPSTSGKPPGEATSVGSSVAAKLPVGACMTLKKTCDGRRKRAAVRALPCAIAIEATCVWSIL